MEQEKIIFEEQLNTRPKKRRPVEAGAERPVKKVRPKLDENGMPVKKVRPKLDENGMPVKKVRPKLDENGEPVKKTRPAIGPDGQPVVKKKRPRPEGTAEGTAAERPVKKVRPVAPEEGVERPAKKPHYATMDEAAPVKKVRPKLDENGKPVKKVRPKLDENGVPVKKTRPAVGPDGQPIVKKKRPEGTAEGTAEERPVKKVRPVTSEENVERPAKKARPTTAEAERPVKKVHPATTETERSVKKTRPIVSEEARPKVIPETKPTSVKRKKVKEKKTFKKAFLTVLIVFSAILVAALISLWVFLSSFEKSRPEHYAQTIIENIENGNYDDIHLVTADGLSINDESLMADKDAIADIIESKINASETTYRRLSSESDGEKNVYLVKAGDEKLLKVEMVKSDKKFNFGFSDWKEQETVLLSADLQPKTIKAQVPTASRLYVNGEEIPEEYITDNSGEIELLNTLRDWEIIGEQPKVATYQVSGIWMNPEVTCEEDGKNPVTCILINDLYTAGFEADEGFADEMYDRVIDCMEPYAYYFSGDAGTGAIASIMLDNSPAYDNATSADVSWMQEHSDVVISEKEAKNFKYYSDGVFSCDIRFLETIYQDEEAVKTWDTNMTWIFVQDGDEYYLADFITNVGD